MGTEQGTPQGGPLSPLLSNILLDDLDKELTRRGHKFVRYADDCNIYVRSHRAGQRVMTSITDYLQKRLKLKVNATKSAVDRPWKRKFLGFSILSQERRIRLAPQSLERGWAISPWRKPRPSSNGWINGYAVAFGCVFGNSGRP